jgi:integrase
MSLAKQAKTLSKGQVDAVLGYLAKTRWPTRNRAIFLLSVKAGLRAKEIASLTWRMTNDAQGEIGRTICLQDSASKGKTSSRRSTIYRAACRLDELLNSPKTSKKQP